MKWKFDSYNSNINSRIFAEAEAEAASSDASEP